MAARPLAGVNVTVDIPDTVPGADIAADRLAAARLRVEIAFPLGNREREGWVFTVFLRGLNDRILRVHRVLLGCQAPICAGRFIQRGVASSNFNRQGRGAVFMSTNTVHKIRRERLTAEDYAYRLPDHFVLHEKENTHASLFRQLHAYYIGRVAEIIKTHGAQTVLDAGCGDGWSTMRLAEAGLDAVGTDWSANGIDHARRLVKNAKFFHGDITSPEFEREFPKQFDAVSFIEVIEHIKPDECAAALQNITRPLKRGGVLVITTPSENFPNTHDNHYRHFTEATLRGTIEEAGGLTVEAIEGYRRCARGKRSLQALEVRREPLLHDQASTGLLAQTQWQRDRDEKYAAGSMPWPDCDCHKAMSCGAQHS